MIKPEVIIREAKFNSKICKALLSFAETHRVTVEEAAKNPTVQNAYKCYSEV